MKTFFSITTLGLILINAAVFSLLVGCSSPPAMTQPDRDNRVPINKTIPPEAMKQTQPAKGKN